MQKYKTAGDAIPPVPGSVGQGERTVMAGGVGRRLQLHLQLLFLLIKIYLKQIKQILVTVNSGWIHIGVYYFILRIFLFLFLNNSVFSQNENFKDRSNFSSIFF